jgi:hypothetical protein
MCFEVLLSSIWLIWYFFENSLRGKLHSVRRSTVLKGDATLATLLQNVSKGKFCLFSVNRKFSSFFSSLVDKKEIKLVTTRNISRNLIERVLLEYSSN